MDAVRAQFGYAALDDRQAVLDLAKASGACGVFYEVRVRSKSKNGWVKTGDGLCGVLRGGLR